MDRSTERIYRRKCFHGQGVLARWLDRIFFSVLGALCMRLLGSELLLCALFFAALLLFFTLFDRKRWSRCKEKVWREKVNQLRREEWMSCEADRLSKEGGVILYPTPDPSALIGQCLRMGRGTAFHCFGDENEDLMIQAEDLNCTVTFHAWREGRTPDREQVEERLKRDAPKPKAAPWKQLLRLPGNRYLLTGCLLMLVSVVLKRAVYWRVLGSLCLFVGTIVRFFCADVKT